MTAGISAVTTCYKERENIQKLIPAIRSALAAIPHPVIVVDDSSPDGMIEIARQLADVAVTKERQGQTLRLAHGMRLARYDAIVTIDSDLESQPNFRQSPRRSSQASTENSWACAMPCQTTPRIGEGSSL